MPRATIDLPSKSEINRCGAYLASLYSRSPGVVLDSDRIERSLQVVSDFRAAHQYPLTKATMGLRSMVNTEGGRIVVSQRLKRMPRIVRKLARMGDSHLARLEDVGGCRAVLSDGDELQRVLKRLRQNWGTRVVRERDYIETPKDFGYRAFHLVVERDERRIEVQLRTESQQRWADAVEAIDARRRLTLKDGTGPAEMMEFFAAAGDLQHLLDYGMPVPHDVSDRLQVAREAVIAAGYYRR